MAKLALLLGDQCFGVFVAGPEVVDGQPVAYFGGLIEGTMVAFAEDMF